MNIVDNMAVFEKMTPEEKRDTVQRALNRDASVGEEGHRAEVIDGELLLVAPRVITQAEVDAYLEDFP